MLLSVMQYFDRGIEVLGLVIEAESRAACSNAPPPQQRAAAEQAAPERAASEKGKETKSRGSKGVCLIPEGMKTKKKVL